MGLNKLIFGGLDTSDYGIAITGSGTFSAPERDVDFIEVPGRNGDLSIDNGRYKNIEVTYPANIPRQFAAKFDQFRAAISRKRGYQRLEDTYHPDEYRQGVLVEGLDPDVTALNRGGQFNLRFNCKPQRFLKSGDLPVQFLPLVRGSTSTGLSTCYIPYKTGANITLTLSYIKPLTIIWRVFNDSSTEIYTEQKTVASGETVTFQQTEQTGATYWRLYFVGWDYEEGVDTNLKCKIKTTTTYNGETFRIDGTIGKTWDIINPTGYVAVPLIKFYMNQIEAMFTDYTDGVEGRHSRVSQSEAQKNITLQVMDCDLQYLLSADGQKLPFKLEDDLSIIEQGALFPYIGEDKTVVFSELLNATMDTFYGWSGLGLIEVYPRWWKL